MYRKKIEPIDKELKYILPKKIFFTNLSKICHQSLKNKGWGSGIREKPIPNLGVKKATDPGSATL